MFYNIRFVIFKEFEFYLKYYVPNSFFYFFRQVRKIAFYFRILPK